MAAAESGLMRPDNPPFWVTGHVDGFAPGTTPNRVLEDSAAEMPVAPAGKRLEASPRTVAVRLERPGFLVLNLEAYPHWEMRDGSGRVLMPVARRDGLIAVRLPAGESIVEVRWRRLADDFWGNGLSAVGVFVAMGWRRRRVGA